jgi:hypothetical protein
MWHGTLAKFADDDHFAGWQLSTVHDYMEPPGSDELERAYAEIRQAMMDEPSPDEK